MVYPLREGSASEAMADLKDATSQLAQLQGRFGPDVPCRLLHGKMKAAEKNEVLQVCGAPGGGSGGAGVRAGGRCGAGNVL